MPVSRPAVSLAVSVIWTLARFLSLVTVAFAVASYVEPVGVTYKNPLAFWDVSVSYTGVPVSISLTLHQQICDEWFPRFAACWWCDPVAIFTSSSIVHMSLVSDQSGEDRSKLSYCILWNLNYVLFRYLYVIRPIVKPNSDSILSTSTTH
jgi:hypothetical protein